MTTQPIHGNLVTLRPVTGLLAVAGALGLGPALVTGFVDDEVNHALGLDAARESALELDEMLDGVRLIEFDLDADRDRKAVAADVYVAVAKGLASA